MLSLLKIKYITRLTKDIDISFLERPLGNSYYKK